MAESAQLRTLKKPYKCFWLSRNPNCNILRIHFSQKRSIRDDFCWNDYTIPGEVIFGEIFKHSKTDPKGESGDNAKHGRHLSIRDKFKIDGKYSIFGTS